MGFQHNMIDSFYFTYHHGTDIAYLLLYVDDIVLVASITTIIHSIIDHLIHEFSMTNLGALNYFLGVSATRTP